MKSAVLLISFNRPEQTRRVLDAIRSARPPRLYVACDGPRPDRPEDIAKVSAVRSLAQTVDWPCDVKTLFHEDNQGCRRGPASAIDWLFQHESEGIILEDDCLPQPSFFPYCDELLERFRDDDRIAQICGSSFVPPPVDGVDYWFSKHADIWGWASWRRAWAQVDLDMTAWPSWRDAGGLEKLPGSTPAFVDYWTHIFDVTYDGRLDDCWDYQWMFTCWRAGLLSVVPRVSQVVNVGFDADATHTAGYDHLNPMVVARSEPLAFPLRHNPDLRALPAAERAIGRARYSLNTTSELAARARRIPGVGPALVGLVKSLRAVLQGRA